jgi:phosphoglycolate phosphatase
LLASVNHVLASLGRTPLPPARLVEFVGNGARALIERALAAVGDDRVGVALDRFLQHYDAHLLDRTRPYPGVPELLAGLVGSGVSLSVVSNKPVAMCRKIVDGLGWSRWFGAILGGDSLAARKPDPSGLAAVRDAAGVSASRMLYVGDSLVDLETARAAGVEFRGVAWGFAPQALRTADSARMVALPGSILTLVLCSDQDKS